MVSIYLREMIHQIILTLQMMTIDDFWNFSPKLLKSLLCGGGSCFFPKAYGLIFRQIHRHWFINMITINENKIAIDSLSHCHCRCLTCWKKISIENGCFHDEYNNESIFNDLETRDSMSLTSLILLNIIRQLFHISL